MKLVHERDAKAFATSNTRYFLDGLEYTRPQTLDFLTLGYQVTGSPCFILFKRQRESTCTIWLSFVDDTYVYAYLLVILKINNSVVN